MNDAARIALVLAKFDQAKAELRGLIGLAFENDTFDNLQRIVMASPDEVRAMPNDDLLGLLALGSYALQLGHGMVIEDEEGGES